MTTSLEVPMIQVERLRKEFGTLTAVNDVSFEVREGEVFGLLGPNGAGKATTINMICGVLQPDSCRVLVDDTDISIEPKKVKRSIGVVPQEIAVYEELTARNNLNFWGSLYGLGGDKPVDAMVRLTVVDRDGGYQAQALVEDLSSAWPSFSPPAGP